MDTQLRQIIPPLTIATTAVILSTVWYGFPAVSTTILSLLSIKHQGEITGLVTGISAIFVACAFIDYRLGIIISLMNLIGYSAKI